MTVPEHDAAQARAQRSPLHEAHVGLGAKMADFGGWTMPIEYAGGGVLREHTAVRETVGLFDVSHLGKAEVRGPGAREFLDTCFTNDLTRIAPGQAQYTLCCSADGGVVDDLIAYLVSEDEIFLVPNAANAATVVGMVRAAAPDGVQVTDRHRDFGVLAVQGPRSPHVLEALGLPTGQDYMQYRDTQFGGAPLRICRTGYTGEHGYELVPHADAADRLWQALLEQVRAEGGLPAGLAARDTLRTEMGYPLHGQDLSASITPVQARSSWAVGWRKAAFWGDQALRSERASGPTRTLRGVQALDRGIPRPGMTVRDASGRDVGRVTSGTFSPTRKVGIGLALIDSGAGVEDGAELGLDVRGRTSTVRVVTPPFVPSHVR